MANKNIIHRVEACPQCGFRFRGRIETYLAPSPFAKKVQMGVIWIMFPALAGVAAFIALTRNERGQMISFDGDKNFIMLMMFTPSLLMYFWFLYIPKQLSYTCPQCSWHVTYPINGKPPESKKSTKELSASSPTQVASETIEKSADDESADNTANKP